MYIILSFVLPLLLGLGLAWALWRYATRNRANDAITEEAVREMHENPERYEERTRDELNAKLQKE